MKKVEYRIIIKDKVTDDYLNMLGLEGWELVSLYTGLDNFTAIQQLIFKREIIKQP